MTHRHTDIDISVVVPVYNEERNIGPFLERTMAVLEGIGRYEILFAMDPGTDRTEQIIVEWAAKDERIGLLKFSRRFGQPAATLAGILNCSGDCCVVIDVDLQDPPETIPELYSKFREGYDVVYAKRRSRDGETWVKNIVSAWGYQLINRISDVKIPRDTGDFRVISRRVIEEIRQLPESHGFLRGLVALVGFRQTFVEYDRHARLHGAGNYNRYLGSLRIGFNGIFGFSTVPLAFVMWMGLFIAILSAVGIIAVVLAKLVFQQDYALGIPTTLVVVTFMGGVQMACIGILGEYIGRIYEEVRQRPKFLIDHAVNVEVKDSKGRAYAQKTERG